MKFQANITVSSLSKVYVNLMPNIIMKFLENNIFLYDKKYGLRVTYERTYEHALLKAQH